MQHFYFGVLHAVARILSRLLEESSFTTIFQGVYFIFFYILPLRVLALVGHLQVEYTNILGDFSRCLFYILPLHVS
jgi:hypothetical protein